NNRPGAGSHMASDTTKTRADPSDKVRQILDQSHLRDRERAHNNLQAILTRLGPESSREFLTPLARILTRSPDPDMALNSLEQFLAKPEAIAQVALLLEHRGRLLETLVQLLSTSQFFS